MTIWLQRGSTHGWGYEDRPIFSCRYVCVGYQKLLCALVMEQAHVSVFEAELAIHMYISYVPLVSVTQI